VQDEIDQPGQVADLAVDGGTGNDRISLAGAPGAAGASSTQITCGEGADRVFRSDPNHRPGSDCETVTLPGWHPGTWEDASTDEDTTLLALIGASISTYPTRVAGRNTTWAVACPSPAANNIPEDVPVPPFGDTNRRFDCKGTLDVEGGQATFNVPAGTSQEVTAQLPPGFGSPGATTPARVKVIPANTVSPSHDTPPPIGWTVLLAG
jgi:hypothetical protein